MQPRIHTSPEVPMPDLHTLTTPGLTTFAGQGEQALFRVNAGVPISEALAHVSDLLHLAKRLAEDATQERDTGRHAWASHYLQEMSKAVVDDVLVALNAWDGRPE